MGKKAAKTPEQIGREAAEVARKTVLREAKSVGLTTRKTLKRIAEGLDAKEQKVFYDSQRGKAVLGPEMIAWGSRKDYAALSMAVLGLKAPDESNVNLSADEGLIEDVINVMRRNGKSGKNT